MLRRLGRIDILWWLIPIIVGVVAGIAASVSNFVIFRVWEIFYTDALRTPTLFFIFPFTGLALSYFLVHLLAWYRTPKSSFHTILEVFHLTPTGLTPREAVIKTISGMVTSVFGGSAGPEGPLAIISGGFSVWLSKLSGIRVDSGKALMVGVAAGFSACFKAPLTGLLFALELPYRRDLEKEPFIEAALASSSGYIVSTAIGTPSLLQGLQLDVTVALTFILPISMGFGLATGGVVYIFTRLYYISEQLAKRLILLGGYPLMLIVGGILTGAVAYFSPQAVGPGNQMLPLFTAGTLTSLLIVLLLRPISTSLTMTFGGTGGLFLPTLLIGGAWGGIIGLLLAPSLMPIFILMGMASFSAGVHKMMLTPIVLIAEIFGSHTIIPIILSTVVCFFVSGTYSFYPVQPTTKVAEEELALERFYYKIGKNRPKELERLTAGAVATVKPLRLRADLRIREALDAFAKTSFRLMPVVDVDNRVLGYSTLEDLALLSRTSLDSIIGETELKAPLTFKENTPILRVIEDMIEKDEGHCFVVDEDNRLTGIISTIDVTRLLMRYYAKI